ncbi:minor tail protein [Microbacterium phage PauloDiaboli]|nr:minor tail protein [Microbacterium phage PauloDiaboli]
MADWGVGNRGTLRITDDGSVVRFYVLCSDPQTYVGSYNWGGTVNGVGVGGTVTLNRGFGSRELGAWGVGYTQNVGISQAATGTSGLGGAAGPFWVTIYRATVPSPPTGVAVDSATATSLRYRFSGNSDGGSPIREWQIGYGTSPSTVQYTVGSSGTSTIGGLSEHTTWYFWSRGRNDVGWSGWSNRLQGNTLGHPTAPQNPSTTASTGVTGRVAVQWTAPATTGAGGIVGYNVFRDGVQIATTTGTGTSYVDNGLTPYSSYSYTIAARNAYSTSVGGTGPKSAATTAIAPGPPSAPRNLSGVSSTTVPGEVQLTWQAPVNTGAGGITGYTIRLADDTPIGTTTGTGLTFTASGLTPGLDYTFKVAARNSLADVEGSLSPWSNQVVVTPIGEPGAPTGVTVAPSSTTSNRLVVSWNAPSGVLSGYSIFQQINGAGAYVLVKKITENHTSFTVDDQPAGVTQRFHIRARTIYTDTLNDGYPGNWGGPPSANVAGVATVNNTQTAPALAAITSVTNAVFNGTYTISQVTANTIRYTKVAANIPSAASGGTVNNITNALFNGTYTMTAASTPTTITYAKTAGNVASLATSGGLVTNTTNVGFNGTFVVTAVNVGANTLSYANTGGALTRAVPLNTPPGQSGIVTNLSNAIFNGTGKVITAITESTLSYAQTNADVAESNAAGAVINATNRDIFNGTYLVAAIPAFNVVQYAKTAANVAKRVWLNPNGLVSRGISPSNLEVRFRSGWSG